MNTRISERLSNDAGDYIIFKNVGAYTVVLRPPFIRPAPPIVSLANGKSELIRRAGTFEDIFSPYGLSWQHGRVVKV